MRLQFYNKLKKWDNEHCFVCFCLKLFFFISLFLKCGRNGGGGGGRGSKEDGRNL